jgi:hypothetical protein
MFMYTIWAQEQTRRQKDESKTIQDEQSFLVMAQATGWIISFASFAFNLLFKRRRTQRGRAAGRRKFNPFDLSHHPFLNPSSFRPRAFFV